MMINDVLMCT